MSTELADPPVSETPDVEHVPVVDSIVPDGNEPAESPDAPLADPPAPIDTPEPADGVADTDQKNEFEDMDEITRLRAQTALYEEFFAEQLSEIAGKGATPEAPAVEPARAAAPEGDPSELRAYDVSDDDLSAAYLEGDIKKIREIDQRKAEVAEHNTLVKSRRETANFVQWYLPVAMAGQKFSEKNPEFAMHPRAGEILANVLYGLRTKNPTHNEAQLARGAEILLGDMIKRSKQALQKVAQGKKRDVGASQQPNGTTPPARPAAAGGPPVAAPTSTQERLKQLAKFQADHNWS